MALETAPTAEQMAAYIKAADTTAKELCARLDAAIDTVLRMRSIWKDYIQ